MHIYLVDHGYVFCLMSGEVHSEVNLTVQRSFWCCIAKTVRNMSQIMHLRKVHVCPQCGTTVHVKRSHCACGHAFALKRKALLTADNQRELVNARGLQSKLLITPLSE